MQLERCKNHTSTLKLPFPGLFSQSSVEKLRFKAQNGVLTYFLGGENVAVVDNVFVPGGGGNLGPTPQCNLCNRG